MEDIEEIFIHLWNNTENNEEGLGTCFGYLKTFASILKHKTSKPIPRAFKGKDSAAYEDRYFELVDELLCEFQSAAGNSFTNVIRNFDFAPAIKYNSILKDCCDELKIAKPPQKNVSIEKKIVEVYFDNLWNKIDDVTKNKIKETLMKEAKTSKDKVFFKEAFKTGAPFAVLLAGNLSGFGVYLAATTALHTVASFLGISLGFGTYMGLTQALSVALGPIGVALASAYAAFRISSPSYQKKIIPSIVLFYTVRNNPK